MSFLTGVNYWASNAGVHTFSNFDEKVIDKIYDACPRRICSGIHVC